MKNELGWTCSIESFFRSPCLEKKTIFEKKPSSYFIFTIFFISDFLGIKCENFAYFTIFYAILYYSSISCILFLFVYFVLLIREKFSHLQFSLQSTLQDSKRIFDSIASIETIQVRWKSLCDKYLTVRI